MTTNTENVTTWADASGRWFAKVALPGGYGPSYLDQAMPRIRRKARNAIRREVAARQSHDLRFTMRIEVTDNQLDSLNLMRSMTFAERLSI